MLVFEHQRDMVINIENIKLVVFKQKRLNPQYLQEKKILYKIDYNILDDMSLSYHSTFLNQNGQNVGDLM